MAAFVIPHHQATLNEMDRIVAAADSHASVLEILNAGPAKIISEVKRAYIKLAARVHPHRGGNFSKERAEQAFVIVARSWEQVKRAAEYDLFSQTGRIQEPFFNSAFEVPRILWFSSQESEEEAELLQAQQDADEAKESELEAATAAAAAAACAAADEGTGGDSASSDDEDDEDSGNATPGGGLAALFVPAAEIPIPDMPDEKYTDFEGVSYSLEHRAHILASKVFYRKQQKCRSKTKTKVIAMNRIAAAKLASLRWLPLPLQNIPPPEIGMMFEQRWQAEQHTRSWAALKGVHGGVKIAKNHESLSASCNTCSTFCMGYTYQPSSGHWFLKKFAVHEAGCFGAQTPADGATAVESAKACKSAFTAEQAARAVLNSPHADLDMNLAVVRTACSSFFSRVPSARFMSSVRKAAQKSMAVDRAIDMAALPGYADALRACGHTVTQPRSRTCCLLFRSSSRKPHSPLCVITTG